MVFGIKKCGKRIIFLETDICFRIFFTLYFNIGKWHFENQKMRKLGLYIW